MGDMKEVGRVVVNVLQPGAGMNVAPTTLDTKDIAKYAAAAKNQSTTDFMLNIFTTESAALLRASKLLAI